MKLTKKQRSIISDTCPPFMIHLEWRNQVNSFYGVNIYSSQEAAREQLAGLAVQWFHPDTLLTADELVDKNALELKRRRFREATSNIYCVIEDQTSRKFVTAKTITEFQQFLADYSENTIVYPFVCPPILCLLNPDRDLPNIRTQMSIEDDKALELGVQKYAGALTSAANVIFSTSMCFVSENNISKEEFWVQPPWQLYDKDGEVYVFHKDSRAITILNAKEYLCSGSMCDGSFVNMLNNIKRNALTQQHYEFFAVRTLSPEAILKMIAPYSRPNDCMVIDDMTGNAVSVIEGCNPDITPGELLSKIIQQGAIKAGRLPIPLNYTIASMELPSSADELAPFHDWFFYTASRKTVVCNMHSIARTLKTLRCNHEDVVAVCRKVKSNSKTVNLRKLLVDIPNISLTKIVNICSVVMNEFWFAADVEMELNHFASLVSLTLKANELMPYRRATVGGFDVKYRCHRLFSPQIAGISPSPLSPAGLSDDDAALYLFTRWLLSAHAEGTDARVHEDIARNLRYISLMYGNSDNNIPSECMPVRIQQF